MNALRAPLTGSLRAFRRELGARLTPSARVAYRWVLGTSRDEMDLMFRLAVLEGAAGLSGGHLGSWSENPGASLSKAQDAFTGTSINPLWLAKSNQGVYSTLLNHATSMMKRSGVADVAELSPDMVLGNIVMGLGHTGGTVERIFPMFGAKVADEIKDGSLAPRDVAGKLKRYVGNKVLNEIRDYHRQKDRYRQDVSGEGNLGDRGIADKGLWQKKKEPFFARLMFDPTDPLGRKVIVWIHRFLSKQPGGKYLTYWFEETLRRKKEITRVEVAKHFDVASGGLGRYFNPALTKMREEFWRTPLADELEEKFYEEGGKVASRTAKIAVRWMFRSFFSPDR